MAFRGAVRVRSHALLAIIWETRVVGMQVNMLMVVINGFIVAMRTMQPLGEDPAAGKDEAKPGEPDQTTA